MYVDRDEVCVREFSRPFRRSLARGPGTPHAATRVCDFQFHESLIYTLEEDTV